MSFKKISFLFCVCRLVFIKLWHWLPNKLTGSSPASHRISQYSPSLKTEFLVGAHPKCKQKKENDEKFLSFQLNQFCRWWWDWLTQKTPMANSCYTYTLCIRNNNTILRYTKLKFFRVVVVSYRRHSHIVFLPREKKTSFNLAAKHSSKNSKQTNKTLSSQFAFHYNMRLTILWSFHIWLHLNKLFRARKM